MSPIDAVLVALVAWTAVVIGVALADEAVSRRRRGPAVDPVDAAYDTLPAGRPDQITPAELATAALSDADVTPMWARRCLAQIRSIPTTGGDLS